MTRNILFTQTVDTARLKQSLLLGLRLLSSLLLRRENRMMDGNLLPFHQLSLYHKTFTVKENLSGH